MKLLRLALAAALAVSFATAARAQHAAVPDADDWTVCQTDAPTPPDFAGADCRSGALIDVDPQGRQVWVHTHLEVSEALRAFDGPLGVFLLAKASSEVYLNGVLIGANGAPAARRAAEVAGAMDYVAFAPREILAPGENEIVLRMSAHRGLIHLASPVHALAIAPFADPRRDLVGAYWPTLVTFGALVAGMLYFAVLWARGVDRRASALLCLMSAFAGGQLFAEISRALFQYDYPFHDLRLLAILGCALGFGAALAAHMIWGLFDRLRWALLAGVCALTLAAVALEPGFDGKATYAILAPTAACAVLAAVSTARRPAATRLASIWRLAALAAFAATILISWNQFLDVVFYMVVAGLLLVLFIAQALALTRERELRFVNEAKAARLALVLEQAQAPSTPERLKVVSAGRIDFVPVTRIACCKGAGDYVELHLIDGAPILHAGSLNELEDALPATFLRAHRSCIVNTAHVRSLERDASGVGRLVLSDGSEAPVSRRIMPKVRKALD
jgi:DNA-binding LytR/AlgR family response regulator